MAKKKIKRPKKSTPCKCADLADKAFAERNAKLDRSLMMNFETRKGSLSQPMLMLRKLDSKKKARLPDLYCTYCPFCGQKYESEV